MNYRRKRSSYFSDIEKLYYVEKNQVQLIEAEALTAVEIDVDQLTVMIDECTSFQIYQLINNPDRKLVLINIKND